MKKYLLTLGCVISLTNASHAKELWDCTFTNTDGNWISPKVAIVVENDKQAQVIDGVLIAFKQSPARATVYRNDDRVLGVRWRVTNIRDKRGQGANKLDYDFRFNKVRNKANLDMKPHGFPNSFNGRGTCKIHEPG